MATTKNFYQDTLTDLFFIGTDVLPAGNYRMNFHSNNTRVSLVNLDNDADQLVMDPIEITNLLKEGGAPYTDRADFLAGVNNFFL